MSDIRKALMLALLFTVVCTIAGLLHGLPSVDLPWQIALLCLGSFGCLGLLLGGIYAFDPESALRIRRSAIGRIAFGLAAGLVFSALWHVSLEGAVLAALLGSILGYLGMAWARHLDFW